MVKVNDSKDLQIKLYEFSKTEQYKKNQEFLKIIREVKSLLDFKMQTKALYHVDGGLRTSYCHKRPKYYNQTIIHSNYLTSESFVKTIKLTSEGKLKHSLIGIEYMLACDDCLDHSKNNTCGKKNCVQHIRGG